RATQCMVCSFFKGGRCLLGGGNCTVDQGPGCRTRAVFVFTHLHGWAHNHTVLDCSDACLQDNMYLGVLKVSTYCCRGRDFCNRRRGRTVKKGAH
ncbi:hypothetical protein TREES_T100008351, partial [Tupaia chinensis]